MEILMNSRSILLTCAYSLCDRVQGHNAAFDLCISINYGFWVSMAQISSFRSFDARELVLSSLN